MMSPERWRQIEELFQAVVERGPAERTSLLEQACASDPELRREVESLLAHDENKTTLMATAISAVAKSFSSTQSEELVGQRLGSYRVTGGIGQGGMAEVFRAVRDDDQYQKQVAIKLVKRDMATGLMVSRFRHERQILASLDHPNIARLLDGGTTDEGMPYFVMEYIEGQPITTYCEVNKLSTKERLKLFRSVCSAVQHAHRNLIVHRDLKPSNIFVTKDGVPKLLDFGIAKLLAPDQFSQDITIAQTTPAMRLMTPDYASPEQVRGETVTTATDIYSLGAVLYEILTGLHAHQFKSYSFDEFERVICREDPEKPSEAAVNPKFNIRNPKLKRRLAGDLDNIVLMAMRKEPERRYPSVEQLSEDIGRYLDGHPVMARKDTVGYRAGKFVRRHKVGMIATLAVIVLIAALVGFYTARLARERDRANQEAVTAERVSKFLVELFEVSDPSEARGNTVTAREILDVGAEKVDRELDDQPEVQARLIDTMGRVYESLGLYNSALSQLQQAVEIRQRTFGLESLELAESLNNLGNVLRHKGEMEKAEPLLRRALAVRQTRLGGEHPLVAESMDRLGLLLKTRVKYEEAEPLYRESLAMRRKLFGPEHPDVAVSLNNLASLLSAKGRFKEAEPLYREALAMRRKLLGEEHPDVVVSLNNLALLLRDLGQYDEAEELGWKTLALRRKLLGPDHPGVAISASNLAGVLKMKRQFNEAELLFREALEIRRKRFGPEHPAVAQSLNNLATVLWDKRDYAAAEVMLREALAMRRKLLGEEHPEVANGLVNLAGLLRDKGQYDVAESLSRQALAMRRKLLGEEHPDVANSFTNLAVVLRREHKYEESEKCLQDAHRILKTSLGPGHEHTQKVVNQLISLCEDWGKPDKVVLYRAWLQSPEAAAPAQPIR